MKTLGFIGFSCYDDSIENITKVEDFMGSNYQKMYEKDYSKLVKKVDVLAAVIKTLNATITNLNNTITNLNARAEA